METTATTRAEALSPRPSGPLTAIGCTFSNNSAAGGKGGNGFSGGGAGGNGAAGQGGAIGGFGSMIIDSCTFTNNSATGGNGGNSFGSNNAGTGAAATGGAIYAAATITKCGFNNNSATPGQSGSPPPFFSLSGASFGGALDVVGTVAESTFTNNSAQHGGGILVEATGGVSATVTGCLFQNNSASIDGGAIYVSYATGIFGGTTRGFLSMSNCTLSGNSAPHGAAIFNIGDASLVNCTVVGNNSSASGAGSLEATYPGNFITVVNSILKTGTTGANVASNSITSHGHNISSDNAAGLLTATGDMPMTDPLFVSDTPQDYGGPTKSIAIGVFGSSPAINAGDDNFAPHRDQRGYFRTGRSDIGSYEYFGGLVGSSSIARSGNDAVISAEVVYGHSYQLERKLNLTDASWQPVGNEFIAADNDIESATASGDISLGRAFYHIRFTN
jgi:predicted outer membrane repeat protein